MILYKYRSLANLDHILDIIFHQRLHCSIYPELNDPFEGLFVATTTITAANLPETQITPIALTILPIKHEEVKEAKDFLGGAIDKVKICSLSSDLNDVRLWSYYADGHKGVVFEIDFSELEMIYEVKYSEKLPSSGWWDFAIALGGSSIHIHNIYEILSRKTKHWGFESEYRIICESKHLEEGKYFDIKGRIKAIYLGTRTSDIYPDKVKLLNKIVPSEIPIYTTKINEKTIKVERGECITERKVSP